MSFIRTHRRFRSFTTKNFSRRFPYARAFHSTSELSMNSTLLSELQHPNEDNVHFRSSNYNEILKSQGKVKVVLLEGVHPVAREIFEGKGFDVTSVDRSLDDKEVLSEVADCHILGIRSKTQLSKAFFDAIGSDDRKFRLWGIGCYCIGTNQVNLKAAATAGVPVFNAPFSNTRSVAEKTICDAISLTRRIPELSMGIHNGHWQKTAHQSHEVRGHTLGIIGYGRIGSQVSILAESFGMHVIYYDVLNPLLSLGNAEPVSSIDELLEKSDIVTLHVPSTDQTRNMISADELKKMKPGAHVINNARGDTINLDDLVQALASGHIGGAAVDVFPEEPLKNGEFETPLAGIPNVILTPHVGGSTMEAQENIARETSQKLLKLLSAGSTNMCVNLPEVDLPSAAESVHRILHLHKNVPGVLSDINEAIADSNLNVSAQYLKTNEKFGYVILDMERPPEQVTMENLKKKLASIEHTLWVRSLIRTSGYWHH